MKYDLFLKIVDEESRETSFHLVETIDAATKAEAWRHHFKVNGCTYETGVVTEHGVSMRTRKAGKFELRRAWALQRENDLRDDE